MLNQSGIYQIRNTVNGKIYVGSSKLLKKRWSQHANELSKNKHGNRFLQNAWNKHGAEAFVFEPILVCTIEDLLIHEQQEIDKRKPEYNLRPGASNNLGYKFSVEQKEALKLIKASAKWSGNMSASKTGSTRPESVKKQISVKMREIASDTEWRQAMVARQTGTRRTLETRAIQSESKRKHYEDPVNRAAQSLRSLARESTARIEFEGATKSIQEWADHYGIGQDTIRQRINAGWELKDVLTKPTQKALIEFNGERKLLVDWAREYGLKAETLAQRLKKWDMHTALTKPVRDWSNR